MASRLVIFVAGFGCVVSAVLLVFTALLMSSGLGGLPGQLIMQWSDSALIDAIGFVVFTLGALVGIVTPIVLGIASMYFLIAGAKWSLGCGPAPTMRECGTVVLKSFEASVK